LIVGPMSALARFEWRQAVAWISPQTLCAESDGHAARSDRSLGSLFYDQREGAVLNAPLPTLRSLLVVWPQLSGPVAAMVILFAWAYVIFQRQEACSSRSARDRSFSSDHVLRSNHGSA
jgi:ABC-2 type transport system permease protein